MVWLMIIISCHVKGRKGCWCVRIHKTGRYATHNVLGFLFSYFCTPILAQIYHTKSTFRYELNYASWCSIWMYYNTAYIHYTAYTCNTIQCTKQMLTFSVLSSAALTIFQLSACKCLQSKAAPFQTFIVMHHSHT